VGFAHRLGMKLESEEAAFIENPPADGEDTYEVSLELADAAEAWLNSVTPEPGVWYVEEQSLFLDDRDIMRLDGRIDDGE
jgi:hypothetical protein